MNIATSTDASSSGSAARGRSDSGRRFRRPARTAAASCDSEISHAGHPGAARGQRANERAAAAARRRRRPAGPARPLDHAVSSTSRSLITRSRDGHRARRSCRLECMVSKYRSVLSFPARTRLFATALVAPAPAGHVAAGRSCCSSARDSLLRRRRRSRSARRRSRPPAARRCSAGWWTTSAAPGCSLPLACAQACVYGAARRGGAGGRGRRRADRPRRDWPARSCRRSRRWSGPCCARCSTIRPCASTAYALESIIQEVAVDRRPAGRGADRRGHLAGGRGGAARRRSAWPGPPCSCARRSCGLVPTRRRRRSTSARSALASPELRALLGPVALTGVALGRGRGRAAVARAPRRVAAGLGGAAGAVERRQHDRRALVRRARLALAAVDSLPGRCSVLVVCARRR